MSKVIMRCKLKLHQIESMRARASTEHEMMEYHRVRFGAVWEGSTEAQAASENAIFGKATPTAEFTATIMNNEVAKLLDPGKSYYVTFTEVPE